MNRAQPINFLLPSFPFIHCDCTKLAEFRRNVHPSLCSWILLSMACADINCIQLLFACLYCIVASDEVILQQCFLSFYPYYCTVDERSLNFTFNRFMMKLFGTTDMNIIKDCQAYCETQPPSEILTKRRCKFLEQYRNSFNCLCRCCCV